MNKKIFSSEAGRMARHFPWVKKTGLSFFLILSLLVLLSDRVDAGINELKTRYIELPESYSLDQIDVSSQTPNVGESLIYAELSPTETGDYGNDGIIDLMVNFDRQAVSQAVSPGSVTMTVTGALIDESGFQGNETVNVIDKGKSDSNGDGDSRTMRDSLEDTHIDDLSPDDTADADCDGFTDLEEYERGTDPNDPNDPFDGDTDALTELEEYEPGTDSDDSFDGDSHTMQDSLEDTHIDDLSLDDTADADSDALTELEEYEPGTDPDDSGAATILPEVTNVSPAIAANNEATEISITGSSFTGATAVSLRLGDTTIELTEFTVLSATEITATVPADTAEGIYDILVTNKDGTNTFIDDKPTFSIYTPVVLSNYSESDIVYAIVSAGLDEDSSGAKIIKNLDEAIKEAFNLEELDEDAGEKVEINEGGELHMTLTSGVEVDSIVPVELTLIMAADEDADVVIKATIDAGTTITCLDDNGVERTAYTGNIDPPLEVAITDGIEDAIVDLLGEDADADTLANAVVFTMGNPKTKLEFGDDLIYVELVLTLPADADLPVIYYLEADESLTIAGVDGTNADGVTIEQGGTLLSTMADEAPGKITYTFGLLLNHMSTYVAAPPSAPSTTTNTKSTVSDGGCFIATAAYGSHMEPNVKVLRDFRDRFLLTNSVGKAIVHLYYTYSPAVAEFIANHDTLRTVVRWSLSPLVAVSWVALKSDPVTTLAFMLLFLPLIISTTVALRRIRQREKL